MTTTLSQVDADIEALFRAGRTCEQIVNAGFAPASIGQVLTRNGWKPDQSGRTHAPPAGTASPRPLTSRSSMVDPSKPYVASLRADQIFADPAYQRPLDLPRVRKMAAAYDPTLLGVVDVSDRGPAHSPRYAVINGQHRRALVLRADPDGLATHLVCNVHRGLTVEQEAALFYDIDRTTRRLSTWDRWNARRAAGDPMIAEIAAVCEQFDLRGLRRAGRRLHRLHRRPGETPQAGRCGPGPLDPARAPRRLRPELVGIRRAPARRHGPGPAVLRRRLERGQAGRGPEQDLTAAAPRAGRVAAWRSSRAASGTSSGRSW